MCSSSKFWCTSHQLISVAAFSWRVKHKCLIQLCPKKGFFFFFLNFDQGGGPLPGSCIPPTWVSPCCKLEELIFTAVHWTEMHGPWLTASQNNDEHCSQPLCELLWTVMGIVQVMQCLRIWVKYHNDAECTQTLPHLNLKLWNTLMSSCSKLELFSAIFE